MHRHSKVLSLNDLGCTPTPSPGRRETVGAPATKHGAAHHQQHSPEHQHPVLRPASAMRDAGPLQRPRSAVPVAPTDSAPFVSLPFLERAQRLRDAVSAEVRSANDELVREDVRAAKDEALALELDEFMDEVGHKMLRDAVEMCTTVDKLVVENVASAAQREKDAQNAVEVAGNEYAHLGFFLSDDSESDAAKDLKALQAKRGIARLAEDVLYPSGSEITEERGRDSAQRLRLALEIVDARLRQKCQDAGFLHSSDERWPLASAALGRHMATVERAAADRLTYALSSASTCWQLLEQEKEKPEIAAAVGGPTFVAQQAAMRFMDREGHSTFADVLTCKRQLEAAIGVEFKLVPEGLYNIGPPPPPPPRVVPGPESALRLMAAENNVSPLGLLADIMRDDVRKGLALRGLLFRDATQAEKDFADHQHEWRHVSGVRTRVSGSTTEVHLSSFFITEEPLTTSQLRALLRFVRAEANAPLGSDLFEYHQALAADLHVLPVDVPLNDTEAVDLALHNERRRHRGEPEYADRPALSELVFTSQQNGGVPATELIIPAGNGGGDGGDDAVRLPLWLARRVAALIGCGVPSASQHEAAMRGLEGLQYPWGNVADPNNFFVPSRRSRSRGADAALLTTHDASRSPAGLRSLVTAPAVAARRLGLHVVREWNELDGAFVGDAKRAAFPDRDAASNSCYPNSGCARSAALILPTHSKEESSWELTAVPDTRCSGARVVPLPVCAFSWPWEDFGVQPVTPESIVRYVSAPTCAFRLVLPADPHQFAIAAAKKKQREGMESTFPTFPQSIFAPRAPMDAATPLENFVHNALELQLFTSVLTLPQVHTLFGEGHELFRLALDSARVQILFPYGCIVEHDDALGITGIEFFTALAPTRLAFSPVPQRLCATLGQMADGTVSGMSELRQIAMVTAHHDSDGGGVSRLVLTRL